MKRKELLKIGLGPLFWWLESGSISEYIHAVPFPWLSMKLAKNATLC